LKLVGIEGGTNFDAVGVGVGDGVGDVVAVGVGDGVGEIDGLGRGAGVLAGVGFTVGFLIATPLFQINLLPCLIQVYLIFETVFVVPSLVHLEPNKLAENAGAIKVANPIASAEAITLLTRAISIA
jgi:hypothetical protein